jgi:hypothetical protein
MPSKTSCMYALAWKNGHSIWRKRWYALIWRISLRIDLYMTRKDQVFIANVVVNYPMWETMFLNVINWPTNVAAKFNAIVKILIYRGLHEGHHFISMTMEVHDAPRHDMDRFIRECAHLFHDRRSKSHLSLSFCNQFFKQRVSITLQYALAYTIKRKIVLANDVYFRPPTTIRSHDLHACDNRGAMGQITSYHKRD